MFSFLAVSNYYDLLDMDNASFLASLAPDLRQEILLTADDGERAVIFLRLCFSILLFMYSNTLMWRSFSAFCYSLHIIPSTNSESCQYGTARVDF